MLGRNSDAPPASDSLDINVLLLQETHHVLLSTSFSSLPNTDSTLSLSEVPTFPAGRFPLFTTLTKGDILSRRGSKTSRASITVPTLPRVRAMLREPVCVGRWVESVVLDKTDKDAQEVDASFPLPWVPEGSVLSSETFKTVLQQRRLGHSASIGALCKVSAEALPHDGAEASCDDQSGFDLDAPDVASSDLVMPTIMLSNSTAALPLSLESSHSIAGIARRRGLQGPAPLLLSASNATTPEGLYPGIPSPFLGTPSAYSPQFEFSNNPEFSMELATMCGNLRSLCPAIRLDTPVEEAFSELPLPSPAPSSDSDEWAFAQDLVTDFDDGPPAIALPVTPQKPKTSLECPTTEESHSWSSAPTLVDSPQSVEDHSVEDHSESDVPDSPLASADVPRQQRRRTVIIETPRNSLVGNARPARKTVDLSHLAGDSDSSKPLDEVPFEVDSPDFETFSKSFAQSTPFSRQSSASMKPPIRGILKSTQKKRVRFSQLPEKGDTDEDSDETKLESVFEGDETEDSIVIAPGRKRAATAPSSLRNDSTAARQSFPLHPAAKSYVRTGATLDTTPTPSQRAARQSLPQSLLSRSVNKSEVGRPLRLSKDTAKASPSVKGEKKAAKAALPVKGDKTTTKVLQPDKGAKKAGRMSLPVKSEKKPGRMSLPVRSEKKVARASLPVGDDKKSSRKTPIDENAARRASEGGKLTLSKSRMPFRSILTKFRA